MTGNGVRMRSRWSVLLAVACSVVPVAGCADAPIPLSRDTATPVQSAAHESAAAFVALANGEPDLVPWARRVTYSIGGARVGSFAPGPTVAVDLERCPTGPSVVEGHTCPVSPLVAVSSVAPEQVIEDDDLVTVGCNRFNAPDVPANLTSVSIRPPATVRDCFSDFAVTLYLDGAGRVAWIDFALSGP